MSSPSPLFSLPPDSRHHVLDYLSLRDCLLYSQVSRQCLLDVVPGLKRRRSRQFCQRHAYQLLDPCRLVPVRDIAAFTSPTRDLLESDHGCLLQEINGDEKQWYIVPSIAERIQALYRALPPSHPSNEDVRQLLLDLQHEPSLLSDDGITTSHFGTCLEELRSISKAHRLHDFILSEATISSSPPPADTGFAANATSEMRAGSSLTTTLEQYIGDVLIAYYCMGHSIAGIVEGPTTHRRWTLDLLHPRRQEIVEGPLHWYRRWVYLHSTILRTFPMTRQQLESYKLASPPSGIQGRTEPRKTEYIHPHYCFLGTGTPVVGETTAVVSDLIVPIANNSSSQRSKYIHKTRWNQFGPLGPAFRGRDRVQTHSISPGLLVNRLHNPCFGHSPTWLLLAEGRHFISDSPAMTCWFAPFTEAADGMDKLTRWIAILPRECSKNRPMTVQPPIVTIEPLLDGLLYS